MRPLKPYITIEKNTNGQFRVHVLIYLEKAQKLNSTKLEYIGPVEKRRKDSDAKIICTQFRMEVIESEGETDTGPFHLCSDFFQRDKGIDYIWVKCITPMDGDPDEGGVGNYDDPDGA